MQALRAQCDKQLYRLAMKRTLESQPDLRPAPGHGGAHHPARSGRGSEPGLTASGRPTGAAYQARAVVVTTGTFLDGRIITGESIQPAGRAGEFPARGLSASLRDLGCSWAA